MAEVFKGIRIWPELANFGNVIRFVVLNELGQDNGDIKRCAAKFIWMSVGDEILPEEAWNQMPITDAQALMDRLWDCGLRPTQGKGTAGQLEAMQKHLEDMRSLVFKKDVANG